MKRTLIYRILLGFPLGVFIGYAITIILSLVYADGYYSPCVPSLSETFGNQINAVLFQAVLCGILGASFAAASLIWEKESWSMLKQTSIYFIVTSLSMMPVAYFTHWMEHSLAGFLIYYLIFIAIFIVMWVVQYFIWRNKIKSLNHKLKQSKSIKR